MERPKRIKTAVLLIPSALLLIVQVVGIGATDSQLRPIFHIPRLFGWLVVAAGIVLSGVSPLTSTVALIGAIRGRTSLPRRVLLLLVCMMLFATSWVGCLWSFSGHP